MSRRLALAALSGALYFLGQFGFGLHPLSWFCLVPVLWALDDDDLAPGRALAVTWLFALVAYLGMHNWLPVMLRDFFGFSQPVALLGFVGFCLLLSTRLVAWGMLTYWLVTRHRVPVVFAVPVVLVVAEWAWPEVFPFYLGNALHGQRLLIQSLDLFGPLGLSFLLALSSAVIYQTLAWYLRRRGALPGLGLIALAILIVADLVYGAAAIDRVERALAASPRQVTVGLVQANVPIFEKHSHPDQGVARHLRQSLEIERRQVDLILWPETGYNKPIASGSTSVKEQVMGALQTPLLFGAVRAAGAVEGGETYNSAFLADGHGRLLGSYDKIQLLPFGEYVPLADWSSALEVLSPNRGHFASGKRDQPLVLDRVRYGVSICYELIDRGLVRRLMRQEPDVMVNLTNDAWFGATQEPAMHLALGAYRAVEHRRFLVRAANTGISAVVDPTGRVVAQTPLLKRANLISQVSPMTGRTFYGRVGDLIALLCGAALLCWLRSTPRALISAIRERRKQRSGEPA